MWEQDFIYGQKIIDECQAAGFYDRHFRSFEQITNKDIQLKYDIDLIAWTANSMHYVEQKSIRNKQSSSFNGPDGFYTHMCVETWSCPRKKTKGWITKSKATMLIYFLTQPNGLQRAYFIDMRGLQNWWKEQDHHKYYKHIEQNENKTESRMVSFNDIKQFILFYEDMKEYKELVK